MKLSRRLRKFCASRDLGLADNSNITIMINQFGNPLFYATNSHRFCDGFFSDVILLIAPFQNVGVLSMSSLTVRSPTSVCYW